MNISEAKQIINDFNDRASHTEEESFMYIEALQLLINETHEKRVILLNLAAITTNCAILIWR